MVIFLADVGCQDWLRILTLSPTNKPFLKKSFLRLIQDFQLAAARDLSVGQVNVYDTTENSLLLQRFTNAIMFSCRFFLHAFMSPAIKT